MVFVSGFISDSIRSLIGLYNFFYLVFYPIICEIFSVLSNALPQLEIYNRLGTAPVPHKDYWYWHSAGIRLASHWHGAER